jgi:hypothetical protein
MLEVVLNLAGDKKKMEAQNKMELKDMQVNNRDCIERVKVTHKNFVTKRVVSWGKLSALYLLLGLATTNAFSVNNTYPEKADKTSKINTASTDLSDAERPNTEQSNTDLPNLEQSNVELQKNQKSDGVLTALEIMTKVDARDEGSSSVANSSMILIDRRDRQRARNLKQYSKKYEDNTKYMAHFLTPSDLKNTVYINYDWQASSRDDDSWLYLPALQKSKRISSQDRSGSFLGSDFTYSDISGFELDWYDYKLISNSEIINGHDCWVIEYTAKPEFADKVLSVTGDTKTKTWVRKDIFMQIKSQIWKSRGDKIKYYSAGDVVQIDGIWTPKKMQMVTVKKGKKEHASIFLIHDIEYGVEITDQLFKSENMQRTL